MQALPGGKQTDPMVGGWIGDLRDAALADYGRHGAPTQKLEAWRHTSLRVLETTRFEESHGIAATGMSAEVLRSRMLAKPAARMVFVNGNFAPVLSFASEEFDETGFLNMRTAIQCDSPALRAHFGSAAPQQGPEHALTARNAGTFHDGAALFLAKGFSAPGPVELVFLGAPVNQPVGSVVRNLIVAERGTEVTVVERYMALDFRDQAYLTDAVTEVIVGDGATVRHVRVQDEGPAAVHLGVLGVRQQADSRFESTVIQVGAAVGRSDVQVAMVAPGASCKLDGLYVGTKSQHLDQNTVIEHLAPHCSSTQVYKGVLDQRSHGVFRGRVLFHEGAIKSSTEQMSRSLLLSPNAVANAKPQLEIDNDDVKATHGATIGQLDADALFYLHARGIDLQTARGLLTWGFVSEMVHELPVPELRSWLERKLSDRLAVPTGS